MSASGRPPAGRSRAGGRTAGGRSPPARRAGHPPDRARAGPDAPDPRRQRADGRRRRRALRGPGHQPPPRPGRPLAARPRASATTRSARPATRATRPSPRRSARPTRPCSTTAPAASTCAGPCRSRATTPAATSCSAWSPPPTSRSPAVATRSSATTTWRSSPRRRPSPRTCRGPSASPSASTGPTGSASPSAWPADALAVCSFGDASANHSTATGAINTAARDRPPAPAAAAAARLRGQRPRHQRAHPAGLDPGRLRPTAPTCAGSRPTAPIPPRSYEAALAGRRVGPHRAGAGLPAPAHGALPRPRRHRRRGRLPDARRDPRRLRPRPASSARPGSLAEAGVATPTALVRPLRAHPLTRCWSWPRSAPRTTS